MRDFKISREIHNGRLWGKTHVLEALSVNLVSSLSSSKLMHSSGEDAVCAVPESLVFGLSEIDTID